MDIAHIDWIPAGTRFGIDEMAYFVGRGERDIDDVLADVDLVVTGPHASAAFPEEMQPFVDVRFTKRLQYDFTDVSTSPVARRWAADRPARAVHRGPASAGRARRQPAAARSTSSPASARRSTGSTRRPGEPALAGGRRRRAAGHVRLPAGATASPQTDAEWNEFGGALGDRRRARASTEYEAVRDDLIERVIEAKLRRLATLDPAT